MLSWFNMTASSPLVNGELGGITTLIFHLYLNVINSTISASLERVTLVPRRERVLWYVANRMACSAVYVTVTVFFGRCISSEATSLLVQVSSSYSNPLASHSRELLSMKISQQIELTAPFHTILHDQQVTFLGIILGFTFWSSLSHSLSWLIFLEMKDWV